MKRYLYFRSNFKGSPFLNSWSGFVFIESIRTINCLNKKRALITGTNGQDVSYLAELLFDKGYEIYGIVRSSSGIPHAVKNRLASEAKQSTTPCNRNRFPRR